MSTEVAAPPSMDTVAIPQTLHLRPIQLTPVPEKLNVAVAPAISELPAVPLLKAAISAPRDEHPGVCRGRVPRSRDLDGQGMRSRGKDLGGIHHAQCKRSSVGIDLALEDSIH